jgi:hypothetical protein
MSNCESARNVVFICKATPEDDEFVLWLGPRLEAAGYEVFADVLSLEPGDRWRKEVTSTLQNRAIKLLLCCRDETLQKDGVQEEIGMALDLSKELDDPRFIIPMRLQKYKKIFGIGELQYIDFLGSWAQGLSELLSSLQKQKVPRLEGKPNIKREWGAYKKRLAITIQQRPEPLTSNWVRIANVPDSIKYFTPKGAIDNDRLVHGCRNSVSPAQVYNRGFFTFCNESEVEEEFCNLGKFEVHTEIQLNDFLSTGCLQLGIEARTAKNFVSSMFRESWEKFCREREFLEYRYSNQVGFHATKKHIGLGKKLQWGSGEKKRFATLRNMKGGRVWQYGVSASPEFWPFLHFRLKARVIFSTFENGESGSIIDSSSEQHRLRRSNCTGWRNKAWHSRLMGFLMLLREEGEHILLPLSKSLTLQLEAEPMQLLSMVSTVTPDEQLDDYEEQDISTLGNEVIDGVFDEAE